MVEQISDSFTSGRQAAPDYAADRLTPRAGLHLDTTLEEHEVAKIYEPFESTPQGAGAGAEATVNYTRTPRDITHRMLAELRAKGEAATPPSAPIAPTVVEAAPLSPWHSNDLFEATKAATGITFGEPNSEGKEQ